MNDLTQTIQQSLLDLLSQAIAAIPSLLLALGILCLTRYGVKPIRRGARSLSERFLKSTSLQSLITQISSVAVWVVGTLLACIVAFPDLGLGDLIGLLGLGSVAIGFAFQDIFKNFLAGILLLLNEPFRIGDQVIVEAYEGTVESIDIRSTAIRTYQGERVVIPNAIVFTNPLQVLTDRPYRRTDLAIGLDYGTSLEEAMQVLSTALITVEGVLEYPPVEVDIVGFGESSIDFMVRYWTKPTMQQVRQVRSRVVIALKQACDRAQLGIPFPIRSLYFFDQKQFNGFQTKRPSELPQAENQF